MLDDVVQGNGGPVRTCSEVHFREGRRTGTPGVGGRFRRTSTPTSRRTSTSCCEAPQDASLHADRSLPEARRHGLPVRASETLTAELWQGARPCQHYDSHTPHALAARLLRTVAGPAGHSALGKGRARLRSTPRRTRAAQGLVVQEHPQSFAHRVPAARRQGEWNRGHRCGRRRTSRAGVQSGRRRARAISREPRRHRVRAEVPAVPRARLEVHHRQHRRGHSPRHAHGAGARRGVACGSEPHRRHGLVGGRRSRGARGLSTRRRERRSPAIPSSA